MGLLEKIFKRKPRGAEKDNRAVKEGVASIWRRGDYTLLNSELIFAATSRISSTLSAMPVTLYKDSKEMPNHHLYDLIRHAPNSSMTSSMFFKSMESCRCTSGNAYALKMLDKSMKLEALVILDPSRVRPFLEESSKELYYRVQDESGSEYFIHNYYVVHIPFLSTNGYVGVNPVSVLFNTLSYNDNIHRFSAEQLNKGINAAIVVEAPANLQESQINKTIESLQAVHKNSGGNILFLESGLTARALNLSPVDTKLFEVEKISRGNVAMVYGMPPHMMGDYSDTSYASQEQQMLEFLSLTMLPIITAYEQELNKKLLTPEERRLKYHWKFDVDTLLRADAATRAEVYQKAIRGGWKTPNEVRFEYGDKPKPNGDKLLASRDLVPLDFLIKNPEAIFGIKEGNGENTENNTPKINE